MVGHCLCMICSQSSFLLDFFPTDYNLHFGHYLVHYVSRNEKVRLTTIFEELLHFLLKQFVIETVSWNSSCTD
jgi:hypothetical protein